jgi:hypothetical protein
MSSATGGGSNSLFADHPSDAQRIKQIQGWMPEAMQYFTPKTSGVAKKAVIK